MRQNLLTAAFVTTLMVLVSFAAPAQQAGEGEGKRWAQGMQGRLKMADRVSRWWNKARIAEQVGISDQQKATLEAARSLSRAASEPGAIRRRVMYTANR